MNRAVRRYKKREVQKINRSAVKATPRWFDKFQKFDDIERIFQKLMNGQIEHDVENDRPTITSSRGIVYDVCDDIDDWIDLWRKVTLESEHEYDDTPLVKINNSLLNKISMSYDDITKAISVIERQKQIFSLVGAERVAEIARTVSIRRLMRLEKDDEQE